MRRAGILLTTLIAVLTVAPGAAAETVVERVQGGFDGFGLPGEVVPVRVRVSADRLVRGDLEGTAGSGTTAMPVEIPGGSVKEYVLFVDIPSDAMPTATVRVVLRGADGKTISRPEAIQISTRGSSDQELVGLLPGTVGARPLPGTATLTLDAGTARFVRVTAGLLEHPEALRSLGTIGATAEDLSRLTPAARTGLVRWIDEGGTLLADVAHGQPIPGLPRGWRTDGESPVAAGMGRVRTTAGAMAEGRWQGLVEPTPRGSGSIPMGFSSRFSSSFNGILDDLGTREPPIRSLMTPLLLYALVAGPVLYLVLKRQRRELWTWVAVPVLALTLTFGSYAGAVVTRGDARSAHMSLLTTGATGGRSVTTTAVTSPGGGDVRVDFPDGWGVAAPALDDMSGAVEPVADAVLTADGVSGDIALNPGGIGLASATGPVELADGLAVTAESNGTDISGTVRNGTPYEVVETVLFVGKDAVRLGTIGAGEEKTWNLNGTPQTAHYVIPAPEVWPSVFGSQFGFQQHPPADTPVNYDLWRVAGDRFGPDFLTTGDAVVAGWTEDFRPQIDATGTSDAPDGRSLLVGRTRITHAGGGIPPLAVHREIVRGPAPTDPEPGHDELSSDEPLVLRFTPPRGSSPTALTLQASDNTVRIEVWRDGAWQLVYEDPNTPQQPQQGFGANPRMIPAPGGGGYFGPGPGQQAGPEVPMTDHDLGTGALTGPGGGSVYVRITQDPNTGLHSAWAYTLRGQS